MVADIVRVPAPDLVSAPEPVVIAPDIVVVPTPSMVRSLFDPPTPPESTSVDDVSTWISAAALNVICDEIVFVPDVLRMAPISVPLVTPSPAIDSVSMTVMPPEMLSVASDATVVDPSVVPSADALAIATTPVEIVVSPVYVFVPDRVNVLDPTFLVTAPAPETIPDSVWSVDEAYVNVVEVPSAMFPAYVFGVPEPREPEPDTVMPPPESLIVVDPV